MNNVREIERINEQELKLALDGAGSWHDDYKDSAYIFVGNLDKRLTEGDVIAVFSQYGEVLDINLPRIPEGGLRESRGEDAKLTPEQRQQQQGGRPGDRRGFGFLLYEDQRSTVLAVDNLNGFSLLQRTLRVDHVRDYKMPKRRNDEGDLEEVQEPSRNAAPRVEDTGGEVDGEDMDLADPMAAYIARAKNPKNVDVDDDKEERRRRKEERKRKREERERRRTDHDRHIRHRDHRDEQPHRSRSPRRT